MSWTIIALTLWLIFTLWVCCSSEYSALEHIEPQPCISNEEFVALMPGIAPDVALTVREVLVDVTGWDEDEIHPDTRLVEFEL